MMASNDFTEINRLKEQLQEKEQEIKRLKKKIRKMKQDPELAERDGRRVNAYIIYGKENRARIKAAHPDSSMIDINRLIAQEWKNLSDTDKVRYQQKAKDAKPKRAKNSKKYDKRRVPSSYIIFCNENRARVKEANPGSSMTDISKLLGAEWKTFSDDQKAVYQQKSRNLMSEYAANMSSDGSDEDHVDDVVSEKKVKKIKKPKDTHAPKRPLSSYLFYLNEQRPEIQQQQPDLKYKDIMKLIGAQWKGLGDAQKAKYVQKAEEAKAEYKVKVAEYVETDEYNQFQQRLSEWKSENGAKGKNTKQAVKKKKKTVVEVRMDVDSDSESVQSEKSDSSSESDGSSSVSSSSSSSDSDSSSSYSS